MTFLPSIKIAEMSGCFGSREKTASHGRESSSFQCTVTEAGVESTVIAPGFTPETSSDKGWANKAGASNTTIDMGQALSLRPIFNRPAGAQRLVRAIPSPEFWLPLSCAVGQV